MKKFWIFILIAGIAIVAMSAINFLTRLGKGDPAPVFSATTLEGKQISLADLKGRPVVVYFFATWCPICRQEFPKLVKAFSSFPSPLVGEGQGEGGLVVLAISEDDPKDKNTVQSFAKSFGANFPIIIDEKGKIADSYQSFALPETFLINKDGIIEWRKAGEVDWGKFK